MRHVENNRGRRRMQFSFTSLASTAIENGLKPPEDCMESVFVHSWMPRVRVVWGAHLRGSEKGDKVNCNFPQTENEIWMENAWEAEIFAGLSPRKDFSADNEWAMWAHESAQAPAKEFFVLHFVYRRFKGLLVSRPSLRASPARDYAQRGFGEELKLHETSSTHSLSRLLTLSCNPFQRW